MAYISKEPYNIVVCVVFVLFDSLFAPVCVCFVIVLSVLFRCCLVLVLLLYVFFLLFCFIICLFLFIIVWRNGVNWGNSQRLVISN